MTDEDFDNLFCPITHELFRDPVTAEDGHVYERVAIVRWINQGGTSPFTRQVLHIDRLSSNQSIKELADRRRRLSGSDSNRGDGQVEFPLSPSALPISPVNEIVPDNNLTGVQSEVSFIRRFRCSVTDEMWGSVINVCLPCWSSSHRKGICGIIFCGTICLAVTATIIYSIVQNLSAQSKWPV